MSDSYEEVFTDFANNHEDVLMDMGLTKEEFVDNARQWSQTADGKLEIQKFILNQEIDDLNSQIRELEESVERKKDAIRDIDDELSKL